jgi:hypothetical protein
MEDGCEGLSLLGGEVSVLRVSLLSGKGNQCAGSQLKGMHKRVQCVTERMINEKYKVHVHRVSKMSDQRFSQRRDDSSIEG